MGLESATYINGLTPAWPLAGDAKNQGDDHIRLLKAVLQASLPNATKPFYFPTAEAITSTITLDATDQNNTVLVDSTSGSVTVNLPSTLGVSDKGWRCEVAKISSDANAAIVTPSSGFILAQVGAVATVRVGVLSEAATFLWSGSNWICWKPGPPVGTVMAFDGATLPAGHLDMSGGTYSNTAFAELFAVLASTTLRDRRGRMDIGEGTGTGLTARVAGTTYGGETHTLTAAQIPSISVSVSGNISATTNAHFVTLTSSSTGGGDFGFNPVLALSASSVSGTFSGTGASTNTSGASHPILSPSIGTKKIIRAC